ncbi:6686_t:CDS:2, partial [Acaulospora morrowiae]
IRQIGDMESILNFRDVGESVIEFSEENVGKIKAGVLFRSGEPDDATVRDTENLLKLDIRTIIDLRSGSHEGRKSSIDYPRVDYSTINGDKVFDSDPEDSYVKAPRRTVNINFPGKKFQRKITSSAPFLTRMKIIFYTLTGNRVKAAKTMTQVLAPRGLVGMYKNILESCDDQIVKILEIMKDKSNFPILVHCKHGKDSTGVIIVTSHPFKTLAVTLSLCGVDDEIIVQDYATSQIHLTSVHHSMMKDMERIGLPECFAKVSPKIMKDLLLYIRSTYGSTQDYLVKIGFDLENQKLVRQNLLENNSRTVSPIT